MCLSTCIQKCIHIIYYLHETQIPPESYCYHYNDTLVEFAVARLQHKDIRGSVGLFFGGLAAGLLIEVLLLGTVCGLYKRRQYRMKLQVTDATPRSTSKCTASDPTKYVCIYVCTIMCVYYGYMRLYLGKGCFGGFYRIF